MQLLKQSTAVDVRVGPAVDATDGVSPETTLTIVGADQAEVLKHDGAATAAMAGTLAAVSGCDGWYDYTCSTSDTGTLGMMTIVIQDSTLMLPIFKDFMVVPANTYDALVAGTANLNADMIAISTSTTAADNLEETTLTTINGSVAATGTPTTTIFDTSLSATYTTSSALNGLALRFKQDTTTTALANQTSVISAYDATTGEITLAYPLTVAPASGDTFVLL